MGDGRYGGSGRSCQVRPGQDLLVAGPIGQLGTALLVAADKRELSRWFSRRYIQRLEESRETDLTPYMESLQELGAAGMMAVGEGGILKAIWEATGAWKVGAEFSLRKIPVRQGTIEVCERCGCDPYRLWCENCLLLTAENGERLAGACCKLGIWAAVIGSVETGTARKICHGGETGYLERPREDALYRILGRERVGQLKAQVRYMR